MQEHTSEAGVKNPVTTAHAQQHDRGTAGGAVGLDLPPEVETVVTLTGGGCFHKTLGHSKIPRCGARASDGEEVLRMTAYHADEQTELTRCSRCPW